MSTSSGSVDVQERVVTWELQVFEITYQSWREPKEKKITKAQALFDVVMEHIRNVVPEARNLSKLEILAANVRGEKEFRKSNPKTCSQETPMKSEVLLREVTEWEEESRTRGSSEETIRADVHHAILDDEECRVVGVIKKK